MSDKNPTVVEKVMDYTKTKIIKGEWKSGYRLPIESDLCEDIGISRSGLREALKILEASNIIEIRRGDGSYIADPQKITFVEPLLFKVLLGGFDSEDFYEFRESIEMAVIQLAISNAEEADIKKLENCNLGFRELIGKQNVEIEDIYSIELQFHEALSASIHNSVMRDIYLFTFQLFAPLIKKNYEKGQDIESALATHEAILDAIRNKNHILAGYAVHISVGVWRKWIEKEEFIKVYSENAFK